MPVTGIALLLFKTAERGYVNEMLDFFASKLPPLLFIYS
jgi:hypothetical protein